MGILTDVEQWLTRTFNPGAVAVDLSTHHFGVDTETFMPQEYGEYVASSTPVYTVVRKRATYLASLPLSLSRMKQDGEPDPVTKGALWELTRKVNPWWTWRRLIEMTEMSLCLWGSAYWFLERGNNATEPPREIYWARPDRVKVVPHATRYVERFDYHPKSGAEPIPYRPDEVIWLRYPNPLDEYSGLSPLAAARLAADTQSAAMKQNRQLFTNGISLGGLVTPGGNQPLSKAAGQEIKEQLRDRAKGTANAHRWLVLLHDAKFQPMTMTPKDAEFIALHKLTLEDVCCLPGTEIVTRDGIKPIEHVQVGDDVLTHLGRWRAVIDTHITPSQGRRIVEVQANGFESLRVTSDHPVYAAQFKQSRGHRAELERFGWKASGDLAVKIRNRRGRFDAITMPMLAPTAVREVSVAEHIAGWGTRTDVAVVAGQVRGRGRTTSLPATIPLTPALGRLLGYWLAEGSSGHTAVMWYFGKHEVAFCDQVIEDLQSVFGLSASVYDRDTTYQVTTHSVFLRQFFLALGKTAKTKCLPSWAWEGDEHFRAALVQAWVNGDGCVRPNGRFAKNVAVRTASRDLAWQMRLMALSLGHAASMSRADNPLGKQIRGREISGGTGYVVRWQLDRVRSGTYRVLSHHLVSPVRSVSDIDYDGPVYNLAVADDESYLTTGGMVHNCRSYGVPLDLIGGQRTYENYGAAVKAMWTETVIPEAAFIADELTEQLLPMFPDRSDRADVCAFDHSDVEAVQADHKLQWEIASGQLDKGAITINEWRKEQKRDPVKWGEEVWWGSVALVPIKDADEPEPELKPEPEQSPDDTPENPPPTEPERSMRSAVRLAYDSEEHRRIWRRFVQRTEAHEKKVERASRNLFRQQEQSILTELSKLQRAAEPNELDVDSLMAKIFSIAKWRKRFREGMRPVLGTIVADGGQTALDEIALGISFDVSDPLVARFLERRAQRFAIEVNETTWNLLKASLAEGLDAGEGTDVLAKRVRDVMGDRIRSSGEIISRTETIGAYNGGALEGYRQSGVVEAKEWLASLDDRTRETHVAAHGQVVALDADFEVGAGRGPAPGQIGIAAEDIQCRCSLLAVLAPME